MRSGQSEWSNYGIAQVVCIEDLAKRVSAKVSCNRLGVCGGGLEISTRIFAPE